MLKTFTIGSFNLAASFNFKTTFFQIGIIGGTGLDDPDILESRQEKYVDTPFGKVLSSWLTLALA